MISKADLEFLTERKAVQNSPVLSVYLDIDQSKAVNLQRRFEASLKDMLRSIEKRLDKTQLKNFAADAERVGEYVSGLEPRAKGCLCFADDSEKFFWARTINAPVHNQARWSDTPYVVPLLEIFDEHERYGVVLVDKAHARLVSVHIGEIEEHFDALAPLPVRRVRTTGTDHILSERRFQSKAQTHVHWHLKHVAESLDKLVDQYGIDRLLLAGPVEATSELQQLLSKRLRGRVVRNLSLPTKASLAEILEAVVKVERDVERRMEKEMVENMISGDAHHPSVLGLERTVYALHEERVWRLIYASGFNPPGGRCGHCGMLFAKTAGSCDYCGGTVNRIDDLLEQMVERVLDQDGKVEQVTGDAALRLQQVGNIGAVLRF
jgi:peptide chain release factor subunit 1